MGRNVNPELAPEVITVYTIVSPNWENGLPEIINEQGEIYLMRRWHETNMRVEGTEEVDGIFQGWEQNYKVTAGYPIKLTKDPS